MWIVKREVFATTIEKAMTAKGRVYAIEIADDRYQPEEQKKNRLQ